MQRPLAGRLSFLDWCGALARPPEGSPASATAHRRAGCEF